MEFIIRKCGKCGFEIEVPEATKNVVCGSCGNINHFGKISSILKRYSDAGEIEQNSRKPGEKTLTMNKPVSAGKPAKKKETVYKPISGSNPAPVERETPPDEDELEFPEGGTASKILTLIIMLTPVILIFFKYFKIPSYVVIPVIILIIVVVLSRQKK